MVPFELGRPFGAPNEPELQTRVLSSLLNMLAQTDGPVLEDFPEPAADAEGWSCPVNLAPPPKDLSYSEKLIEALNQEMALLQPWYEEAVKNAKGRTMVGISNMEPNEIIQFIVNYIHDPQMSNPNREQPMHTMLKLVTDDIKYFYYQAALVRPGQISDVQIGNWFWGETLLGKTFLKLREVLRQQNDPKLQPLANRRLVPHHQSHRRADD